MKLNITTKIQTVSVIAYTDIVYGEHLNKAFGFFSKRQSNYRIGYEQ